MCATYQSKHIRPSRHVLQRYLVPQLLEHCCYVLGSDEFRRFDGWDRHGFLPTACVLIDLFPRIPHALLVCYRIHIGEDHERRARGGCVVNSEVSPVSFRVCLFCWHGELVE